MKALIEVEAREFVAYKMRHIGDGEHEKVRKIQSWPRTDAGAIDAAVWAMAHEAPAAVPGKRDWFQPIYNEHVLRQFV